MIALLPDFARTHTHWIGCSFVKRLLGERHRSGPIGIHPALPWIVAGSFQVPCISSNRESGVAESVLCLPAQGKEAQGATNMVACLSS